MVPGIQWVLNKCSVLSSEFHKTLYKLLSKISPWINSSIKKTKKSLSFPSKSYVTEGEMNGGGGGGGGQAVPQGSPGLSLCPFLSPCGGDLVPRRRPNC